MKNYRHLLFRSLLAVAFALVGLHAAADKSQKSMDRKPAITIGKVGEMGSRRMLQSAHPVQLKVQGASLRISSRHQQLLPIYRHDGRLYVAMQLTPGVNWLNGLPSGRYRINNRTIRIN